MQQDWEHVLSKIADDFANSEVGARLPYMKNLMLMLALTFDEECVVFTPKVCIFRVDIVLSAYAYRLGTLRRAYLPA